VENPIFISSSIGERKKEFPAFPKAEDYLTGAATEYLAGKRTADTRNNKFVTWL